MNLVLMHEGRPGDDLGIAHLLKHWCNPVEMWEDVADGTPEAVRPLRILDDLADVEAPWEPHGRPASDLEPHWEALGSAYRDGYGAWLQDRARGFAGPVSEGWQRDARRRVYVRHAGEGVILMVKDAALYTAFRPADFRLRDPRCPPRDATSVSLRRAIATNAARKYLQRHARRDRRRHDR